MGNLKKLKENKTLSEKIYDSLKAAIIELELKPGQIITEEDLAEQLGVSRTPLKAAINKLIFEGLMSVEPGKGTCISELTIDQLQNHFQVRSALEELSVELATKNSSEEDIDTLTKLAKTQDDLLMMENKAKRFFDADIEFHSVIANASQNEYLANLIKPIMVNCSRFLYTNISDEVLKEAINEHYELVEAIKSGDVEKAKESMKKHIAQSMNRLLVYPDDEEEQGNGIKLKLTR